MVLLLTSLSSEEYMQGFGGKTWGKKWGEGEGHGLD